MDNDLKANNFGAALAYGADDIARFRKYEKLARETAPPQAPPPTREAR